MKKDLHPKYVECKVVCACGNSFETRATVPKMHLDICSACHPFYTGKQKLVDTAGRVEQYLRKFEKSQKLQEQAVQKSEKKNNASAAKNKAEVGADNAKN